MDGLELSTDKLDLAAAALRDRWKLRLVGKASGAIHSTIIRSDHSTSETKIAGFPNFAPH
jgi:hypothetical protein